MATKTKTQTTILDRVRTYLERFISFPNPEDSLILSVWILHTWTFMESFPRTPWVTPYIYVWSDEPGSGKTRLMDIIQTLVYNPEKAGDITSAALFALIEESRPTMLIDEIDTVFRSGGAGNEALRRTMNTGYTHTGYAIRKAPGRSTAEKFSTFCAKMLAGIQGINSELPETVRTRSVPIKLEKRQPAEAYYNFLHGAEAEEISQEVDQWIRFNGPEIIGYMPEPSDSLKDRAFEISFPLLQLAHVLGVEPEVRTALIRMLTPPPPKEAPEITMLRKIREQYDGTGRDKLFTDELVTILGEGWSGKLLSNRLRPFGIEPPIPLTINGKRGRGYIRSQFTDAWRNHLESIGN